MDETEVRIAQHVAALDVNSANTSLPPVSQALDFQERDYALREHKDY